MRYMLIILSIIYGTLSDPAEEFATGNHIFTAAVYKELVKANTGNIIVSPFSAEAVLALTNEGAKGKTATEIVKGLSLPGSRETTQKAFQSLLPRLKRSDDTLKLLSANRIYAGRNVTLENDFKSIATNIYDSSVENVDFTQKSQTAEAINKWVEDNTNKKIKNLINPASLTNDTRLVLVNALYFSGKWLYWFESYLTQTRKFFNNKNESVDVPTMRQKEYLNYYENPTLNAKFLELPYEGDNIKMVIVLPNSINGLERLEGSIDQAFQPQPYTYQKVDVLLPRFAVETEIDFVPILQSLGIRTAFTEDADLSGISSTNKELLISRVAQKAFIDVQEAGTEAGAATDIKLVDKIADEPRVTFNANHPFLFYITYNQIVMFAGRIANL